MFLPDYSLGVHHFDDLTNFRGGRGLYSLDPADGDSARALAEFTAFLQNHGLSGQPLEDRWLEFMLSDPATQVLAATILLCLTLGALQAVLRCREHGVRRLQGHSGAAIMLTDHGQALRGLVAPWAALCLLAGVTLYFFNGFSGFSTFCTYTLPVVAILLAATSIGFAAGLFTSGASSLLGAIKGDMPAAGLTVGVHAVRLIALILVLGLTASAQANLAAHRRLEVDADKWGRHTEPVIAYISGSAGESLPTLSPALRDMDQKGEVLLANSEWYLPKHTSVDMRPVILMNTTAARESGAVPAQDLPAPGDQALLAVPPGATEEEVAPVRENLLGEFSMTEGDGPPSPPGIRQLTLPGHTTVFTYATSYGTNPAPATVQDPIIAVLPPGLIGLSDYNLASSMTQAKLLLRDSAAYERLAATPAGADMLGGSQPAAAQWAESRKDAMSAFRTALTGLLIALVLATAAVAATVLTHQLRHSRELQVRGLMGQPLLAGRRGLIAVEVGYAAIVAAWLIHRQRAYLDELAAGTSRAHQLAETASVGPPLVMAAAGFVLLWAVITAVTIIRFDDANMRER